MHMLLPIFVSFYTTGWWWRSKKGPKKCS